eukprot:666274-Rhodomonas_salina.1
MSTPASGEGRARGRKLAGEYGDGARKARRRRRTKRRLGKRKGYGVRGSDGVLRVLGGGLGGREGRTGTCRALGGRG